MEREQAEVLLTQVTEAWVADDDADVVYSEVLDGRRAIRMRQQTRDFTTVWFDVGERTVSYEAYVLPAPPQGAEEVYRQCLVRNLSAWRVHFAIDRDGEVYLRGKMPLAAVSESELEYVIAEIYELVEVGFRPMVRAAFGEQ